MKIIRNETGYKLEHEYSLVLPVESFAGSWRIATCQRMSKNHGSKRR